MYSRTGWAQSKEFFARMIYKTLCRKSRQNVTARLNFKQVGIAIKRNLECHTNTVYAQSKEFFARIEANNYFSDFYRRIKSEVEQITDTEITLIAEKESAFFLRVSNNCRAVSLSLLLY